MRRFLLIVGLILYSFYTLAQVSCLEETSMEGRSMRPAHSSDGFQDDSGFLWIAGSHGILRWDGYNLTNYSESYYEPKHLCDNQLLAIFLDSSDRFWIGTYNYGYSVVDPSKESSYLFKAHPNSDFGDSLNHVRKIRQYKDKVYLAGDPGLVIVNMKDLSYDYHKFDVGIYEYTQMHRNTTNDFWIQNDSILYACGYYGLMRYNMFTKKITPIPFPFRNKFDADIHRQINKDEPNFHKMHVHNNRLHLESWGAGFSVYDIDSQEWENYLLGKANPENGAFNDNLILQSYRYKDEILIPIMHFDYGKDLLCYNLNAKDTSSLSISELAIEEIMGELRKNRHPWVYELSSGNIAISKYTDFCSVKAVDQNSMNSNEKLFMLSAKFQGKELLDFFYPYQSPDFLWPSDLKEVEIEVGLVDPPAHKKLEYAYKWNRKHWEKIENRKFSLNNIKVSEGTLKIRARFLGEESWIYSPSYQIKREIRTISRETFRSVLLMGIIVVGGGIFLAVKRFKRKKKQYEIKLNERLVNSQMATLRSQMNPHFLFNSLNSINSYISKENPQVASSYLSSFAKLIRRILRFSELDFINLDEELDSLKLYLELENMRFDNHFAYQINLAEDINPLDIQIPPMMLQPFIENALWHGLLPSHHKGKLKINFQKNQEYLQVSIEDNGIGRVASNLSVQSTVTIKESKGIEITRERFNLLKEKGYSQSFFEIIDLYNHYKKAIGTLIKLSLPIKKHG